MSLDRITDVSCCVHVDAFKWKHIYDVCWYSWFLSFIAGVGNISDLLATHGNV